jgi:PPOX class probable F420-dependent enzyme
MKMEQTATLPRKAVKLFLGRNWGNLVGLRPDRSPHVTPVWVDYDGEHVLVNSAYGRAKVRHIQRDPRVAIDVLPSDDQQSGYVSVSGMAELVDEGADDHIDKLAKKYLGLDEYPYRAPGERRVIIRITPERVDLHGVAE